MFQTRFVDCYLPLALIGTFTYRLPLGYDGQLQAGSLVVVPFNERNIYTGIVRRVHETQPAGYQVKDVIEVLEETPVLTENQIKLLDWISDY